VESNKKKKKQPLTGKASSELLSSGVATVGGVVTRFTPGNTSILELSRPEPADPVLMGVTNWAQLNAGAIKILVLRWNRHTGVEILQLHCRLQEKKTVPNLSEARSGAVG
jgi:hypothetical protein